jgi:hypothetical protein
MRICRLSDRSKAAAARRGTDGTVSAPHEWCRDALLNWPRTHEAETVPIELATSRGLGSVAYPPGRRAHRGNLDATLRTHDLAALVQLSTSHFARAFRDSKLFRRFAGESPGAWRRARATSPADGRSATPGPIGHDSWNCSNLCNSLSIAAFKSARLFAIQVHFRTSSLRAWRSVLRSTAATISSSTRTGSAK